MKFKAAGADFIESPYEMGAVRMAQRIIRPSVTSFFDLAFTSKSKDIQMEEIPVSDMSRLNNVMLKDSGIRQKYDLILNANDAVRIGNPSGWSLDLENMNVSVMDIDGAGNADHIRKVIKIALVAGFISGAICWLVVLFSSTSELSTQSVPLSFFQNSWESALR